MTLSARINAQRDAYARAVGRPAFWAPRPLAYTAPTAPVSPWVARAQMSALPAKEYTR